MLKNAAMIALIAGASSAAVAQVTLLDADFDGPDPFAGATVSAGAETASFDSFGFLTDGSVDAEGTVVTESSGVTELTFTVDGSGSADLDLFFSWSTSGAFGDGDFFDISVNGESLFFVPDVGDGLTLTETPAGDPAPFFEFFASPGSGAVEISPFAGLDEIEITITLSVTSGLGGTINFDSLLVTSTPIPAPGAFAMAAAGLGFASRRRRA